MQSMAEDIPRANQNTADAFKNEVHSSFAQLVKDYGLPQQIFHALVACGYNTIASVSKIDSVSSIEEFLRDSYELFSTEELKMIYGRFYALPQKFRFLPGHTAQLQVFIEHCRDRGRIEMSKRKCDSTSKIGYTKRRVPRQGIPLYGTNYSSQISDTSLTDNETEDPNTSGKAMITLGQTWQSKRYEYSSTLSDIQMQLEKWCRFNPDPKLSDLQHNVHYQVIMEIKEHQSDMEGMISSMGACVTCCMCLSSINLQLQKDNNFCLSNAYRHLKKCVNKPKRLSLAKVQNSQQEDISVHSDHQYGHRLFPTSPSCSSNEGPVVLHVVSSPDMHNEDIAEHSESVVQ